MKRLTLRAISFVSVVALLLLQFGQPAVAAPGDIVADVVVNEPWPRNVSPSVAFDGTYLYHVEYAGSTLHRINVPPAGGTSAATGQVDFAISGAPSGIMTLSYDAGRDAFWAVGGDALSIYLLSKTGSATRVLTIDPQNDRPGFNPEGQYSTTEMKVAYDRQDDTIWYSPDAAKRIFHYHTFADALGTAVLVEGTPYIDVNIAPNNMAPQCGYDQSSGVAVGGAHLFISVAGCNYVFEYTKTGGKVGSYAYNTYGGPNSVQDIECDNVSYGVPVIWARDGYDGHIRAFEQPAADACVLGGGPAQAPPPPPPPPPPLLPPLPPLPVQLPSLPPIPGLP